MATTFGPIEGRLSVGINVSMSPSTVTSGTTSVTITWTVYAKSDSYGFNDPQTMTMSNAMSATANYTMVSGSGASVTKQVWSGSQTVSTSTSGTVSRTLTAAASGLFNGGTPSHTRSITIPKRPNANPAAPSAVTAVRDSDTQATVAWTSNATAGAPYTSLIIQRRVHSYPDVWSGWSTIATTSAGATSYVDTTTSTNHRYDYKVRANNSAGSSSYVAAAAYVYTTPAGPSSVTAVGINNGAQIQLSWVDAAYFSSTNTWTVQRSVNGGAYANVATGIAQGTVTWTDPSPGVGSNKYRVAAFRAAGSLLSAYTESNTLSTIVVPLAPTLLSPNGTTRDFAVDQTFSWWHNHGGDGIGQSHYIAEYSSDGGTTWLPLATNVASSTTFTTVPGGTLTNGVAYLWRVATQGSTTVAFSPWSAPATVVGSSAPTVTPSSPAATVNTLPLVAEWAYNQDESSPQTAWEASLFAVDGTTLLQALAGTTGSVATFSYPLVDATSYMVRVRARSGAGVWSEWADAPFNFLLLPPAAATLLGEYQRCSGTVVLSVDVEAPVEDVTVTAEAVSIERSINGGEWVTLVTGISPPVDFIDTLPSLSGVNEYRATTVSGAPSYFVGEPVVVEGTGDDPGCGLWVFVSYGPGFSNILRVQGEPRISEQSGRTRESHSFLGREKPVLLVGDNTGLSVSFSGKLHYDDRVRSTDECKYDSPPVDWRHAAHHSEIVCYRDYTGRRIFGELSGVEADEILHPGFGSVKFTVLENDYTEAAGTPRTTSLANLGNGYTSTSGCRFVDQLNGYSVLEA